MSLSISLTDLQARVEPPIVLEPLMYHGKFNVGWGRGVWGRRSTVTRTSRATDRYNTITVHYIKDWELVSKVLQIEKMWGTHTDENLAIELDTTLDKWNIVGKVPTCTIDTAANIGKAVEISGIDIKVDCYVHTLNLASMKTIDISRNFTKYICPVVGFMHRSHIGAEVLTEKQTGLGLKEHSLIMDVKTHWNSTYLMVERFLEQRPAILAAVLDPQVKRQSDNHILQADLDDVGVIKCQEYVDQMKHLYDVTLAISGGSIPSISLILPLQASQRKNFTVNPGDSNFVTGHKKLVTKSLQIRYTDPKVLEYVQEASILAPETKSKACISVEAWVRMEDKLADVIRVYRI